MAEPASQLTVRHFDRDAIELTAQLVIAEAHREQIRFSAASGASDSHIVSVTAEDISAGGAGAMCSQFIPRMAEGLLRVFGPSSAKDAHGGAALPDAIFEQRVKVRRVRLASDEPSYALGLAFFDPDQNVEARVKDLLKSISASAPASNASQGSTDA
jgi:hypothetical protein